MQSRYIFTHIVFFWRPHRITARYCCKPNQNRTKAGRELPDWYIIVITAKHIPGHEKSRPFLRPSMVRSVRCLWPLSSTTIIFTIKTSKFSCLEKTKENYKRGKKCSVDVLLEIDRKLVIMILWLWFLLK